MHRIWLTKFNSVIFHAKFCLGKVVRALAFFPVVICMKTTGTRDFFLVVPGSY